jgi:hypothetical protein
VACSSWKKVIAEDLNLAIHVTVHKTKFPRVLRVGKSHQNYFKFTIVRNPYGRLVSCYKHKIHPDPKHSSNNYYKGVARELSRFEQFYGGMTFEAFVNAVCVIPDCQADPHFRSQVSFITVKGRIVPDFVGRFENLKSDAQHIISKAGIDSSFPHLMATEKVKYENFYNKELKDKVFERYKMDFDTFGYPSSLILPSKP